eukprot:TRINITY_DN5960_c0_g1_i1.p2 TRINITY_DN5960_c0_g1~~TRINITY_DN5960_c0_g1_i1.p2  ORF type:complete len:111 (+),score=1.44 TRINITY_DN5960_c0_g1_i1:1182-1514(+)
MVCAGGLVDGMSCHRFNRPFMRWTDELKFCLFGNKGSCFVIVDGLGGTCVCEAVARGLTGCAVVAIQRSMNVVHEQRGEARWAGEYTFCPEKRLILRYVLARSEWTLVGG